MSDSSHQKTSPLYKFKWNNYTMKEALKDRQNAASYLRRDAATLIARAEQIEAEAYEWEKYFVEVNNVE